MRIGRISGSAPLQPGKKRVMIVEYFAPNVRQFPEPAVTLEINSVTSLPNPVGATAAVDGTIAAPNGRIYAEFTTAADTAYWVQYRDSATAAWQTSPVAVAGTGTTISWLDDRPAEDPRHAHRGPQYQLIVAAATAASAPLTIAAQPEAVRAAACTGSTLAIRMQGAGPFTYQWYRDGTAVAGATAATLNLAGLGVQNEGDYHVIVSDGRSVIQSAVTPVKLLSANPARIVNLAVRANLDAGANPLITGFVIEGTAVRSMLVRGVGPAPRPVRSGTSVPARATSSTPKSATAPTSRRTQRPRRRPTGSTTTASTASTPRATSAIRRAARCPAAPDTSVSSATARSTSGPAPSRCTRRRPRAATTCPPSSRPPAPVST